MYIYGSLKEDFPESFQRQLLLHSTLHELTLITPYFLQSVTSFILMIIAVNSDCFSKQH